MNVLMIGATSTVAQAIINKLLIQNAHIYCLARNASALEACSPAWGNHCVGYQCYDFTDTQQTEIAINNAIEMLGRIDLVIIAHGFLPDQSLTETDFSLLKKTFEINSLSVMAQILAVMAHFKQRGKGKLAVITSVAGDRGRPRNFTYGAAKGSVSVFLQGLRSTCYGSDIEIYDFKLGPVDTPMTIDHEKNFSFSTPDKVANIMLNALRKRRYTRYVPGFWFWVMLAVKIMPEWLFQRLKFLSAR